MTTSSTAARLCASAVTGLLLLACGCATDVNRADHGVTATQFQDMVVPAGLRLRDRAHESYSRQEASWRTGHFVYVGNTDIDEAMGYVRLRMPQHSWSIISDEVAADQGAKLRFERGIYTAEYTFQRHDGSTEMVVVYSTDYSRR
jgi:hypothetical protein